MAKKKRNPFTKKQLDILYECWKEGKDTKERLALIEERMPKASTLTALKVMRRMARTDTKWLRWTTRQKNLKEKEKLEKQKERERKAKERAERKKERERKREERLQKQTQKSQKEYISKRIDPSLTEKIEDQIPTEFFFCPDINQHVTNLTCIFRVFGDFSFGTACDKCKRMNKHIPVLKEVVNGRSTKNAKKQRTKRNKASRGRRKAATKKPAATKAKATRAKKNSTKRTTATRRGARQSRATNRRGS